MGDRMGSSPIDRTKKILTHSRVSIFFTRETGLERDVKKTAQCAVFSPRRDSNRVSCERPDPLGFELTFLSEF